MVHKFFWKEHAQAQKSKSPFPGLYWGPETPPTAISRDEAEIVKRLLRKSASPFGSFTPREEQIERQGLDNVERNAAQARVCLHNSLDVGDTVKESLNDSVAGIVDELAKCRVARVAEQDGPLNALGAPLRLLAVRHRSRGWPLNVRAGDVSVG